MAVMSLAWRAKVSLKWSVPASRLASPLRLRLVSPDTRPLCRLMPYSWSGRSRRSSPLEKY